MKRPGPLRILLAEDNAGDVFLVRRAIQKYRISCEVTLVDDGEAAIRHIASEEQSEEEQQGWDLILLDLNLPRFSGCEILQRLRASSRWRDVPVIVLTSSDSPKDRAKARDLGAMHYFCKPPDLAGFMKLGQLITSVIGDSDLLTTTSDEP